MTKKTKDTEKNEIDSSESSSAQDFSYSVGTGVVSGHISDSVTSKITGKITGTEGLEKEIEKLRNGEMEKERR